MGHKFLRIRDVMRATGIGRSTIYALAKQGRFPKPIRLLDGRASAWLSNEVEAWQEARIAERDEQTTSENARVSNEAGSALAS